MDEEEGVGVLCVFWWWVVDLGGGPPPPLLRPIPHDRQEPARPKKKMQKGVVPSVCFVAVVWGATPFVFCLPLFVACPSSHYAPLARGRLHVTCSRTFHHK